MSIYIQQADQLKKLTGEKLTSSKIIAALGFTPSTFDGDYESLTNKPITNSDDDNTTLYVQDSSGNIIAMINESGLTTVDVNVDGTSVKTFISSAETEIGNLSTKAEKSYVDERFDSLTFADINGDPNLTDSDDSFSIADKNGYVIAYIDVNGLVTPAIKTSALETTTIKINGVDYTTTIGALESSIGAVQGQVSTNAGNIKTNADNIKANADDIDALQEIVTNDGLTYTATEFIIQDNLGNTALKLDGEALTVRYIKSDTTDEIKSQAESNAGAILGITNDLSDHTKDADIHITAAERESWDAKADTNYVDQAIADLVDSAPDTLDTLNELAVAIKGNASVIEALDAAITTKADKTTVEGVQKEVDAAESEIDALQQIVTEDGLNYTATEFIIKNDIGDIALQLDGEALTVRNIKSDTTDNIIERIEALSGRVDPIEQATHTHDNKAILDDIDVAFTSTLKQQYDKAEENVIEEIAVDKGTVTMDGTIAKITGVAAQSDLETLQGVVQTKANASDLEALDGRVETAEGEIDALQGLIDEEGLTFNNDEFVIEDGSQNTLAKFDKDGLTVTSIKSNKIEVIEQLVANNIVSTQLDTMNATIGEKADTSTVNGINSALTTHTNNDNIHVTPDNKTSWSDKYTKSEIDGKVQTINETTGGLNTRLEAAEAKLKDIDANANNYELPTASSTELGGVKIGQNISIDSNGVISTHDPYILPEDVVRDNDLDSYYNKTQVEEKIEEAIKDLPTQDTDTTYTFENGSNGTFIVTPKGGTAQTVSVGATQIDVDDELKSDSINPVQNKVVYTKFESKADYDENIFENDPANTLVAVVAAGGVGPSAYAFKDIVLKNQIIDNLTSAISNQPLSAAQGKVLDEKIQAIGDIAAGSGNGDMLTTTYDPDKDGRVESADKIYTGEYTGRLLNGEVYTSEASIEVDVVENFDSVQLTTSYDYTPVFNHTDSLGNGRGKLELLTERSGMKVSDYTLTGTKSVNNALNADKLGGQEPSYYATKIFVEEAVAGVGDSSGYLVDNSQLAALLLNAAASTTNPIINLTFEDIETDLGTETANECVAIRNKVLNDNISIITLKNDTYTVMITCHALYHGGTANLQGIATLSLENFYNFSLMIGDGWIEIIIIKPQAKLSSDHLELSDGTKLATEDYVDNKSIDITNYVTLDSHQTLSAGKNTTSFIDFYESLNSNTHASIKYTNGLSILVDEQTSYIMNPTAFYSSYAGTLGTDAYPWSAAHINNLYANKTQFAIKDSSGNAVFGVDQDGLYATKLTLLSDKDCFIYNFILTDEGFVQLDSQAKPIRTITTDLVAYDPGEDWVAFYNYFTNIIFSDQSHNCIGYFANDVNITAFPFAHFLEYFVKAGINTGAPNGFKVELIRGIDFSNLIFTLYTTEGINHILQITEANGEIYSNGWYCDNIKTINGQSLYGVGNITIEGTSTEGGTSSIVVDNTLSTTSTNPVQNAVVTNAINSKVSASALNNYLKLTGGTITGDLTVNAHIYNNYISSLQDDILQMFGGAGVTISDRVGNMLSLDSSSDDVHLIGVEGVTIESISGDPGISIQTPSNHISLESDGMFFTRPINNTTVSITDNLEVNQEPVITSPDSSCLKIVRMTQTAYDALSEVDENTFYIIAPKTITTTTTKQVEYSATNATNYIGMYVIFSSTDFLPTNSTWYEVRDWSCNVAFMDDFQDNNTYSDEQGELYWIAANASVSSSTLHPIATTPIPSNTPFKFVVYFSSGHIDSITSCNIYVVYTYHQTTTTTEE